MFAALTARLQSEIATIRNMVALYDHSGTTLYNIAAPDPWSSVRSSVPKKLDFQIYNHCAALTRLYAVYAAFVDDLIQGYLRALPELYDTYAELPIAVSKQHRLGLCQILLKLGDAGPYSHLEETNIVTTLSRGLSGERPYTLLPEAFFVDRHNYRLEAVVRMLGYLGLENATHRIANHPGVKACIVQRFGESATLLAELKRFVDLRNEAAHTHVDEVIGPDDFLALAELVDVLCDALAEILSYEVMRRRNTLGQVVVIGEVVHIYAAGTISIVKMKPCRVAVGEEVVILRGTDVSRLATIRSIQDRGRPVDEIETSMDQELGIRLNRPCRKSNRIGRIAAATQVQEQAQLDLFSSREISITQMGMEPTDTDELEKTAAEETDSEPTEE